MNYALSKSTVVFRWPGCFSSCESHTLNIAIHIHLFICVGARIVAIVISGRGDHLLIFSHLCGSETSMVSRHHPGFKTRDDTLPWFKWGGQLGRRSSPASGSRCPWRTHGSTAGRGSGGTSWEKDFSKVKGKHRFHT